MKKRLTPNPTTVRRLKLIGFSLIAVGGILVIIAYIDFFSAFNDMNRQPSLFFLFFIAFPMLAGGAACLSYAYRGRVARFAASQTTPVISDALHDIRADIGMGRFCPSCGNGVKPDEKFCTSCGTRLSLLCAKCGAENEADAAFCKSCGKSLT